MIEASVNASRVKVFLNRSRELLKILNGIRYSESIVRRTGGGSEYEGLLNLLIKSVEEILHGISSSQSNP